MLMCSRTQASISLARQLHNYLWSVKWKYEVCQQTLHCDIIHDVIPHDELRELSVYGPQWISHIVQDTIARF